MGLETYIDATEAGTPLYEAWSFAKASRVDFDAFKYSSQASNGKISVKNFYHFLSGLCRCEG